MGLGMVSAAIRDRLTIQRIVDRRITAIETPARPDYWFGHGYRLAFTPTAKDLTELRAHGRRQFGAIPGIEKFTIVWENDVAGQAEDLRHEKIEETNVLVFRTDRRGRREPAVSPIRSDDDWRAVERLMSEEIDTRLGDFTRWVARRHRDAVADGRALFYGYRQDGDLIAFVGAYRDGTLGSLATPYTLVRERGRGLFGLCLQSLCADAAARGIERIVLEAAPLGYQERMYLRLGAQAVSRVHADIVVARDGEAS